MKLYIDMIAFYLQRAGGITSVWKELIIRLLRDKKKIVLILQKIKCENIYFNQIMELKPEIVYEQGIALSINRYLPVMKGLESGSSFCSTYYRITLNKNVKQYNIVHDFTYEYFVKGLKKAVHSKQKELAVKHSNAIICVSKNTRNDFYKFYPWFKCNVYVIYNGVSDVYKSCENTAEIEEIGKFNTTPFLIYVGSRAEYKKFDTAVMAAKRNRMGLVIIGGGKIEKAELRLLNNNLKDNWIQITGLSDARLNCIYNKAFALIYPSEYEGFGMPVIEAQRAGCPVIAKACPSVVEIIGYKETLFSGNSNEGIDRIIKMLKNPKTRQKIIDDGYDNAKNFSWEQTYEAYRNLIFQ